MKSPKSKPYFALIAAVGCLTAWSTVQAQGVKVNKVTPPEAEQTQTLDILIDGGGFDDGSTVTFFVAGTTTPSGKIVVNGPTQALTSKQLKANITIAGDADINDYDVEVKNTRGRRGKGNTLFKVLKVGSGGNNNPYDGEDIPLVCALADDANDSVHSDDSGDYIDGVDKVSCTTGGIAQPNFSPLSLNTVDRGPSKKAIRHVDLVFDSCVDVTPGGCAMLPCQIFDPSVNPGQPECDALEGMNIVVEPHPESQNHIQFMGTDMVNEVPARIIVKGTSMDFIISMIGDTGEGQVGLPWCGDPDDAEDAETEDVSVWNHPDGDSDGLPDGYTVTTHRLTPVNSPTNEVEDFRLGMICSRSGPINCEGPAGGNACNLLARVAVQFTLTMVNK